MMVESKNQKGMTREKALKMAIEALRRDGHRFAVDAYFYDEMGHENFERGKTASREKAKRGEAIAVLEGMLDECGGGGVKKKAGRGNGNGGGPAKVGEGEEFGWPLPLEWPHG